MKKKIVVTGTNGSFEGEIEVKFNYRSYQNQDKTVYYHRVFGTSFFDGKVFKSNEFTDEQDVFTHIDIIESIIRQILSHKAYINNDSEIIKQLRAKGFE